MNNTIDLEKYLILVYDEDKTSSIQKYYFKLQKTIIKYHNSSKEYEYDKGNVKILINSNVEKINFQNKKIVYKNSILLNVSKIINFGHYHKVFFSSGNSKVYESTYLIFQNEDQEYLNFIKGFNYLKELSKVIGPKLVENTKKELDDENNVDIEIDEIEPSTFLYSQYENIKELNMDSIAYYLLSNKQLQNDIDKSNFIIYPFGFNPSQRKAINNALNSRVSVIEGPPGTGKTQTILSIISSLVFGNKKVAVTSNNNFAINNVKEKLNKYDLDFFVAPLGRAELVNEFKQKDLRKPLIEKVNVHPNLLFNKLSNLINQLDEMNLLKNHLAKKLTEFDQWLTEKFHFTNYWNGLKEKIEEDYFKDIDNTNQLIDFINDYEFTLGNKNKLSLFKRIKLSWRYKIKLSIFRKYSFENIKDYIQHLFYEMKIKEIDNFIKEKQAILNNFNLDQKSKEYIDLSMIYFKNFLFDKYVNLDYQNKDNNDLLGLNESDDFFKYYPVVLSTTFSLRKCLKWEVLYDYIIIDESSQVDILTGFLALTVAKNLVVVGDKKQLSNIVTKRDELNINNLIDLLKSKNENLDNLFDYSKNFLNVITDVFGNDYFKSKKITLLKEHYRCHPKIINFCNKTFYDNELVILTNDNNNKNPLCVYQTVEGNHCRNQTNQREIDVIRHEVFKNENLENYQGTIGIISPYRKQVDLMKRELKDLLQKNKNIEIETVNKFQGKECDVIIFSTVDNQIGDFVSQYDRINVAVSRAVKKFILVTNGNENKYTVIDELKQYIKYNNFKIEDSKVTSIFDVLYLKETDKAKKELLEKYNSEKYDSLAEKIMDDTLIEVLDIYNLTNFISIKQHYWIKDLISKNKIDINIFDDQEKKFINNKSHIDFLLISKNTGKVFFAIEVDGYKYHSTEDKVKNDAIKDNILKKMNIKLERFSTTQSLEKQRLEELIKPFVKQKIDELIL